MPHSPPRRHGARLALGALFLAGCAARGTSGDVAATVPLAGRGFTVSPPAGAGWTVDSDRPDAIVFIRHAGPLPYLLTAGAQAVDDAALARALAADPQGAARTFLVRRLQAPRRDNVSLDTAPATLGGAPCVSYRAVQVDRYDPERILPDQVERRYQYVQRGLLCAHPRPGAATGAGTAALVQVFYNERFLRDAEPEARVGEDEVNGFFEAVRWEAGR